jgi:hypothetical protein
MESPFATMNAIINEPSNPVDELRIIAKDGGRLTELDRAALRRAADEFDHVQRALVQCYSELVETKQHLEAATDRLTKVQGFNTLTTAINAVLGPYPARP